MPLPQNILESPRWKEMMKLNPSWRIDPKYKSYPYPADSRMSMACKITIFDRQIQKVSFLPVLINKDSQPQFLNRNHKEFRHILKYMQKITKAQSLDTKFTIAGNEIVISS